LRWHDETTGAEPSRLVVALLFDHRPILGHMIERLQNGLEGDLVRPYCNEVANSCSVR
jgi:hypothetical protein